ncbi:AI-2E family transporter [Desulfococcaceae bacterium HSG8]|nr:AI-2E family transporter [Desulfococcaceae bacterium HSG8]
MSDFRISDPFLRRMVYAVGIMVIIALSFYTVNLLRSSIIIALDVLTPFIVALLMAYIFAPAVFALQQRLRLGRIMGTLVLYIVIFMLFFLLLAFLIPKILSEFIKLVNALKAVLPGLLANLSQNEYLQIDERLIRVIEEKISQMEINYEELVSNLLPGLKKVATGSIGAVAKATKGIFTGLGSVFGFFSLLMFIGIISFYLIVDWEKISPMIRKMVPPKHRERVFEVLDKMDNAVGGFLRGQLTVSAIVGIMFAAGLFCMGFVGFPGLRNYCVLIGTAAAIGGFIPYLGPLIGVTPAILIILFASGVAWGTKLIALTAVLILFGIIQTIEGFILQPKIVGRGAGLHPLVVMFALILGAQFGIGGMIIAVPLASVIRVLVLEFYWLPIERRESESGG